MEADLEKIKKYLPKGYCKKIATDLGVTPMTVSNALSGKSKRYDIIEKALKIAEENIAVEKKLAKLV